MPNGSETEDNMETDSVTYQGADGDTHRVTSSIVGLSGLPKPLEFLGLLGLEESKLENLPAIKVCIIKIMLNWALSEVYYLHVHEV